MQRDAIEDVSGVQLRRSLNEHRGVPPYPRHVERVVPVEGRVPIEIIPQGFIPQPATAGNRRLIRLGVRVLPIVEQGRDAHLDLALKVEVHVAPEESLLLGRLAHMIQREPNVVADLPSVKRPAPAGLIDKAVVRPEVDPLDPIRVFYRDRTPREDHVVVFVQPIVEI